MRAVSLDRASIGAGRSYVGVFGDEVKYFPEEKFTNLLKAVRGFRVKYGNSVWYRSRTLTTDMPNPNHLGEYDWILKLAKQNDKKRILLLMQVSFVYNDTRREYVARLQQYEELAEQAPTVPYSWAAFGMVDCAAWYALPRRWSWPSAPWSGGRNDGLQPAGVYRSSSYPPATSMPTSWAKTGLLVNSTKVSRGLPATCFPSSPSSRLPKCFTVTSP